MTQRAMQIIKELAELNDKVFKLENKLKQELRYDYSDPSDCLCVMTLQGGINKNPKQEMEQEIKDQLRLKEERIQRSIEFGEPIAEEDKRFLRELGMPKNEFLDALYTYGYYSIEDLFWNYKSRETIYNKIDFQVLRDRIGRHTLHDWWNLYDIIAEYTDATVVNSDFMNIDFNAEVDAKYFNMNFDNDNFVKYEISLATRNCLARAGVKCIGDLLLVDDFQKFKKETRGLGPKAWNEVHNLLIKVNEGAYNND